MTATAPFELAIERHIDAPPETVFKLWTERLEEWWAPKPWTTRIIDQNLRPGDGHERARWRNFADGGRDPRA